MYGYNAYQIGNSFVLGNYSCCLVFANCFVEQWNDDGFINGALHHKAAIADIGWAHGGRLELHKLHNLLNNLAAIGSCTKFKRGQREF